MRILFSIIIAFFLVSTPAMATPYSDKFLKNTETKTFLGNLGATETGAGANAVNYSPRNIWMRAINTLLGLLGVFAVSVIIYGGVQFMVAGGDPDKAKKALKLLQYAVLGLVVIFAAWGLVNVILVTIGRSFNL